MLLINKPTNADRYEIYYNKRSKELSMALSGSTYNLNNTNISRQNIIKLISWIWSGTCSKKLGESFLIEDDGLVKIHVPKRSADAFIARNSEVYNFSQLEIHTINDEEYYVVDIGYIPKVANFRESFIQYLRYIQENSTSHVYNTMMVQIPIKEWSTGRYIKIQCKIDTSIAEVKDVTIVKNNYYKETENTYKEFSEKDLNTTIKNPSELFKINTLDYMLQKSLCS